ncbi:MAG: methyltransferase, partial [Parafilimonas sp.]
MPNDYFRFKQFIITQDKCAMKVCTDACLFGAWAAHNPQLEASNILDIGTGTGLLSLIYAQKNMHASIDAIEIDEAAVQQARENFEASIWKERLHVYNTSIQQFATSSNKKYDVIICNPPFYENDLKSENKQRNLALHSDALTLEELISDVDLLLGDDGSFFVLLPFHRTKYFE